MTPHLVRIEGVMNVGKSPLADMLADAFDSRPNVIHIDREFANPDKSDGSYAEAIDVSALHTRLASLLHPLTWTILEAVCLGEVAPEEAFGRGFVVYVKRVAVLGPDLHVWHGFDEGAARPEDPLFRSIYCYHMSAGHTKGPTYFSFFRRSYHSFGDKACRA